MLTMVAGTARRISCFMRSISIIATSEGQKHSVFSEDSDLLLIIQSLPGDGLYASSYMLYLDWQSLWCNLMISFCITNITGEMRLGTPPLLDCGVLCDAELTTIIFSGGPGSLSSRAPSSTPGDSEHYNDCFVVVGVASTRSHDWLTRTRTRPLMQ